MTVFPRVLTNHGMTAGALERIPVEHFPAARAGSFLFLLFYPLINSAVLHELQIFDDPFMVPDPVHHMNLGKILQAFAGKVGALETPGYLLLLGTAAKTVAAVGARAIHVIREAPIAADFLDGDSVRLRHFLQFFLILILIREVSGASFAVQPTDSDQSVIGFFHKSPFHPKMALVLKSGARI
jgi:hypothetical protein